MPADFAVVKRMILEHIKSSVIYGTYVANPNYQEEYIHDEIRKANDDIVSAICANKFHTRRIDYTTKQAITTLSNGASLPSSIGGWSEVRIKRTDGVDVVGKPLKYETIEILRNSTNTELTAKEKEGYYDIVGTSIYFSGSTAGVSYCNPSKAAGTTLNAPSEYETAVRDLALSRIYMKHEDKPSSASHYGNLAMAIISAITSQSVEIPTLERND